MTNIVNIQKGRHDNGHKFINLLIDAYLKTCLFPFLTYDQGSRIPLSLCDASRAIHLKKLLLIGDEIRHLQELSKIAEPNPEQGGILFAFGVCWSQIEKHTSGEYTAVYLPKHTAPRSITLTEQRFIVDSHIGLQSSHTKASEIVFDQIRLSDETNDQILSELFMYEENEHYKARSQELLEIYRQELNTLVLKINNSTLDVTK